MVRLWTFLSACALLLWWLPANALLVDYAVTSAPTIRDCVAGATACDGVSSPIAQKFGGMPGDTTASASINSGGSSAFGSASLSGAAGAPILKGSSVSSEGLRVNSTMIALQRYVFEGTETALRTFTSSLTYSQSLIDYPIDIGIYAAIQLFALPSSKIDVGDTAESLFAALFAIDQLPGFVDLGYIELLDDTSTLNGSRSLGVNVTLNPGDAVWAWVALSMPVANGGWVDASHTLVTGWNDPTGLRPAAVAIPEPGTATLVCVALLMIAWSSSRLTWGRRGY